MDLSESAIAAQLTTAQLGRSLELKLSTGSTNDDAREAARAGAPHGHVIVADHQSSGRGSRGRSWSSPPGSDLYFSLLAKLDLAPIKLPPLTLALGLALAEALQPSLPEGQRALVKWPNDVWVARRKLVGILVESASLGGRLEPIVIGIGVNVNRLQFPPDLATPATSLALLSRARHDRATLLAAILNTLEPTLARFADEGLGPFLPRLSARLALRGERATCAGVTGTVEGLTDAGALLLADHDRLHECLAGTLRACEAPDEAAG